MTTVAYRSGFLASDSAITRSGMWCGSIRKIARAPDGSLAGASGSAVAIARVLRWVECGMEGDPDGDDVSCLIIKPDGSVHLVEVGGIPVEVEAAYHAIGSGSDIAIGAMAMGASAQRAVETACQWDRGRTAGPVVVEKL